MAKNTFKKIILDVRRPDDIERAINTARKLAKNVTIGVRYEHQSGLEISIRGPRDQIKIFEHKLIDTVTPTEPGNEEEQEFIDDDEDSDDDNTGEASAESDDEEDEDETTENRDVDDDDPSDDEKD